jgi:hypothetical protein
MARKSTARTSSVAALRSSPPPAESSGPSSMSVDVRKISNGWISTHSQTKDGEYEYKEEFHESKPEIEEIVGVGQRTGTEGADAKGTNHLAGAIALMNKGQA